MKLLNGSDLAGYIKQRQGGQARSISQGHNIIPKLVIIRTNPDPVVDSYMKLKTIYGADIGVEVEVRTVEQADAPKTIEAANNDTTVHGIIVQIPLPDPKQTTEILNAVDAGKDVDGLGTGAKFDPATPMAINWLLAGYNIELRNKKLVIVGHGRLVGQPLAKIWKASNMDVTVMNKQSGNLASATKQADVLVCATGVAGLIKKDMIKDDAVIVDAGVATDKNGLVGDVDPEVRQMPNITITPEKGGVGPLTVCALFENVILSARRASEK